MYRRKHLDSQLQYALRRGMMGEMDLGGKGRTAMKKPEVHESVFVAPGAAVMGNVRIGRGSSVFFGAVIRSEQDEIVIGQETNIQDNCVLHIERGQPLHVGDGCTVGHGAILHSCTVGDNTLVGMGAIVLNGAVVGSNCIIGAGALVPQNAVIPDGSLVMGVPGRVRRSVTAEEIASNRASAAMYITEAAEYKAHLSKNG